MDQDALVPRHLIDVIRQRLSTRPVIVLTGPRTIGKSTLLSTCARRHQVPVIDLDSPPVRRQVADDPPHFAAAPLNLGQQSFRHDDRLYVMPADRLWTEPSGS